MTISSALNNALSGLRANGRLAEITSGNLANALTPGYGRQDLPLSGSVTGGQGTGVAIGSVERALDPDLTAARRIADGNLAETTERLDGLGRLERAIGTVEDRGSLANRMKSFEDALRNLGEMPESVPRQTAAAEAARDLADKMNMISTESARVRQAADAEISRRISEVNKALENIAHLNRQIQIFANTGRDTAAMIDERERLVDKVAQNVPIRTSMRGDGMVEVRTAEGLPLADRTARSFVFVAGTEDSLELTPPPVGAGPGIAGRDVTPGTGGAQKIRGGALAGLFALRDEVAPAVSARMDALAAEIIERGQVAAEDGTVGAGDYGLFVDTSASYPPGGGGPVPEGLAGSLAVNPSIDPMAGGEAWRLRDGTNAGAPSGAVANANLVRARLDAFAEARPAVAGSPADLVSDGARSLFDRIGQIAERTARDRVSAEAEAAALGTTRETLSNEEAGKLGVDTDLEMQRLIQIEQAYAANAQVIQTASRMLDELGRIA